MDVLATAREKIHLPEIGIPSTKIRYTVAGRILVEIPGDESAAKADVLATKLREIFPEDGEVKISRPTKRSEIRISGLDPTIKVEEIIEAVATIGSCDKKDVKVREIKKRSPKGMGAAWVQCPITSAKTLADKERITIGWTAARVEVLKARPMTCYRCMGRGHTANNCTLSTDRSKRCYNCCEEGHWAKNCTASSRCPVCSDESRPANHRFGGKACDSPITRGKEGTREAATAAGETDLPTATDAEKQGKSDDRTINGHNNEESGHEEAMQTDK